MAQSNVLRLLQGQFSVGGVSSFEVTQARVSLETTQLARQDALGQMNGSLAQLAGALGMPLSALDGLRFSFADFTNFPDTLTTADVRKQALFNRADVRGALAEFAAAQQPV